MAPMADTYKQLLDATIQHLEDLKARGVRHVSVSPEALRALSQPAPRPVVRPQEICGGPREAVQTVRVSAAGNQPAIQPSLLASAPADNLPASSPSPAASLPSPEKAAAFAALRERALACVKCPHLASSRKNVVFGVGSIEAQLMFVGEAPGADEDEQGEPFVGKAGQLLTKIIQATGLEPGGCLHREYFEVPARHARPERRQPQADAPRRWPRAFRICTSRLI